MLHYLLTIINYIEPVVVCPTNGIGKFYEKANKDMILVLMLIYYLHQVSILISVTEINSCRKNSKAIITKVV